MSKEYSNFWLMLYAFPVALFVLVFTVIVT